NLTIESQTVVAHHTSWCAANGRRFEGSCEFHKSRKPYRRRHFFLSISSLETLIWFQVTLTNVV
ncbi:MAG: hypothetical protein ACFFEW_04320, partial [Candidatus Thorarchaeota archaeon]